jgi:hypothetical protein
LDHLSDRSDRTDHLLDQTNSHPQRRLGAVNSSTHPCGISRTGNSYRSRFVRQVHISDRKLVHDG